MTPTEALYRLLAIYVSCFEYDVAVFSQPWMYWCLLIPAFFYLLFFIAKWYVLTAPFWIPIGMAFRVRWWRRA